MSIERSNPPGLQLNPDMPTDKGGGGYQPVNGGLKKQGSFGDAGKPKASPYASAANFFSNRNSQLSLTR